MKSPFTGKEMSINREWRKMNFRKNEFNILFHTYKCSDTGEQFEDSIFAALNYNQGVNEYREKYAIPFPEQIKDIRKKYGLTAKKISDILGFGANTYRNYEAGEVPSQANAKLIQLAEDPREFKKLVSLCNTLSLKVKEGLINKIETILIENKKQKAIQYIENYFYHFDLPNSKTGYRITDSKKFTEMVVYFAEALQPYKTKMNKLLFYADFLMFKQRGISISGVQYVAIDMGPVPNNFHGIFEYLANEDIVDIQCKSFPNGTYGEQFVSNENKKFDSSLFSEAELSVLNHISEVFKTTSTSEIIAISHKEKAWIENFDSKSIIDYKYAFELSHV
jgi:putative zinc finger/helix-turn-helix YgiT family protein